MEVVQRHDHSLHNPTLSLHGEARSTLRRSPLACSSGARQRVHPSTRCKRCGKSPKSPPHRSRCHHHRLHSRDQVTSGYTTKLRLLRHDTASKAVLAILRRKFKPTPRSTTRSRLQPTARNNVVGTIPHTARSTLRDSSRSHCCKHLSLHCLRLSDLRHGPQRKEGASQEERHRQCSCRKGHRTIK